MKKLYCALLGVILSINVNALCATAEEAAASPFVKIVRETGGLIETVAEAGCCGLKKREVIRQLPAGIAVVGGHLGKLLGGAKDFITESQAALKSSQVFVKAVLGTAKMAGIDTTSAEVAWKLALKTGNQATLFVDTNAVFRFFSNPKTEGIDSRFDPIRSLLTEADANYLWFLGSYASILMPDDYNAALKLTRAQNAVLFTMEVIEFFKQPGAVTITSTNDTTTVLTKGTTTLVLKNNTTVILTAISKLAEVGRMTQFIGDLVRGSLTLTQLSNLVPGLKATPTFYVADKV